MEVTELKKIVDILTALPHETEWIEFKHNFHSPEEIGERISAISNSACIWNKPYGYIVFGIEDSTHQIKGTTFYAKRHKKGNEELEMWLSNRLNPRIDFESYEFDYSEDKHISLYRIPATVNRPVTFLNQAYIRVGSLTKLLIGYPDKEGKIWRKGNQKPLESIIIKKGLTGSEVISLLSVETYFDLIKLPMPQTVQGIVERFKAEHLVIEEEIGYGITELGALVLAKDLKSFDNLRRKSVRVIVYKGKGKQETVRERIFEQGYAVCFSSMMDWINGQLPANEEIGRALRHEVNMYPEIALREIVANMIIHQDLAELGFPMVEIYKDRIEISNPGIPLISTERFIDEYQSRNESLADLMRRLGFCEEKGSGMDKAITANELYQLPAIRFQIQEKRTIVSIFGYRGWSGTYKEERLQACYQHACLKYVSNEMMTNQSLRERFGIESKNYSMISRLIKDAIDRKLIKEGNPENKSNRLIGYIPYWA